MIVWARRRIFANQQIYMTEYPPRRTGEAAGRSSRESLNLCFRTVGMHHVAHGVDPGSGVAVRAGAVVGSPTRDGSIAHERVAHACITHVERTTWVNAVGHDKLSEPGQARTL
jgi:hypothetical protein